MTQQRKHRISAATAVSAAAMASVLGASAVGPADAVARPTSLPAVQKGFDTTGRIFLKYVPADLAKTFYKIDQAFIKIDQAFIKIDQLFHKDRGGKIG